jgi:IS30 family transposase
MKKSYEQLGLEERDQIAVFRAEGCGIREIARRLRRDASTVSRELRRNAAAVNTGYYLSSKAEERAVTRKQQTGQRLKLKNFSIREYVITHLHLGWSPELIAGRISKDQPKHHISHEAIYQYIYAHAPHLRRLLARKHRKRWRKGHSRKHQKVLIKHRIALALRPTQVNERIRFGHWESDTMEGLRSEPAALNVMVERKSRFVQISKVSNRTARATRDAMTKRLEKLPAKARRSITYDNGRENCEHYKLNQDLKCRSYFCEPYRSWEKGSVENTIGLIRRFIPKGWDISTIQPRMIAQIEFLLNHRPKKCLGFATPAETFNKCGVALPP